MWKKTQIITWNWVVCKSNSITTSLKQAALPSLTFTSSKHYYSVTTPVTKHLSLTCKGHLFIYLHTCLIYCHLSIISKTENHSWSVIYWMDYTVWLKQNNSEHECLPLHWVLFTFTFRGNVNLQCCWWQCSDLCSTFERTINSNK